MAELSQSDLDALFADLEIPEAQQSSRQTDPAQAQTPQPAQQTDLDKLMADLEALGVNTTPEPQETTPVNSLTDNESLSQDQIDALLKEFLG
jgi:hypothetical protein